MGLTETQQLLLNGLELFKVEEEAIIGIMITLQNENQMDMLMNYMAENQKATQEDILLKTALKSLQVQAIRALL
jgi:hypothetical protein